MPKTVVILQSSYIPWKGYFDLIRHADDFVFYDCAQYTKNDWRNRNIILGKNGPQWLTIPVFHKFLQQTIEQTQIANTNYLQKHWKTLAQVYAKSKYYRDVLSFLEPLWTLLKDENKLSPINQAFIRHINVYLEIETRMHNARDFILPKGKTERLVAICKSLGASDYLSGPAAKTYLDVSLFEKENIKVRWFNYDGYKPYKQLYPAFHDKVSILDLLFNTGKNAKEFMK